MRFFKFIIFIAVFAGIGAVTMLLWNAILPDVTGCGHLSYWQSVGLLVISRLLFGGFGTLAGHMHHHHHRGWRKKRFGNKCKRPIHMHEIMDGMSKEEKRQYIRNFFRDDMEKSGNSEKSEGN